MANMEDEYKDTAEEDKETSDDINYQGTSKGVSGERNSTNHKVIFVDNLPSSMDKNGFIELFRSYGIIVDVKFLKHKTGAETGYGFVEFEDWEDGRKAINDLNWQMIENRNIRVSRAKPPTKKVSLTNLYVENVPKSWDDEMLRAYFSQICTITQARVLVNRKNGQSRGVGFVHCSTNDQAKNAIQYINVDNRGVGGNVDLYVKFAKISRAERKMQRQREGGCGIQDRRKQLQRMYQNQDGFQDQYQSGVTVEGKKFHEQSGLSLHGGNNYSPQRNDGRDIKPKNRRARRKKFEKRQSKGIKKSAQSLVSTREVNAKDASDQKSHQSSLETSQDSASVPPATSVPGQVSGKGMMAPTLDLNIRYSEPIPTKIGFSKMNLINPGLQVQIPSVNSQGMHIPGHQQKSNLYGKFEQTMGQFPKAVDWQTCDGKRPQCVTTGALPKGVTGGVMYPNNSYVTQVARNRTIPYSDLNTTSPYPYPWSPTIVTPTVGTPMGVGSPLSFYGNIVRSPRIPAPDYHPYANQLTSPRSVEERSSFRFVGPVSPALIDCSELQSPNPGMQQNRMYWPVSPPTGNATPSVTTPFTLQQQMPNLSINDGTSYYMNRAMGTQVTFPGCRSDAAGTPRNAMTENRVIRGGGRHMASPNGEQPWGHFNKLRQYPGAEIKRDEAVSPISSPISPQGLSPRYSWPGSYFTTQPYSITPAATHIQTRQVAVPQRVVQSNMYNQSQLGVASPSIISTPTESRGRPKYVENANELGGNRPEMKEFPLSIKTATK